MPKKREPLPERLARPVAIGHGAVDDHHGNGAVAVAVVERPAVLERDAERVEVAGTDRGHLYVGALLRVLAFEQHRAKERALERPVCDSAARSTPAAPRCARAPLEGRWPCSGVMPSRPRSNSITASRVGVVAEVEAARGVEAAQEEAGADQRHHRERGLRDHQRVARGEPALAGSRGAAVLDRRDQVRTRRPERGQQPEQQPGQERQHGGEGEHAAIESEREVEVPPEGRRPSRPRRRSRRRTRRAGRARRRGRRRPGSRSSVGAPGGRG